MGKNLRPRPRARANSLVLAERHRLPIVRCLWNNRPSGSGAGPGMTQSPTSLEVALVSALVLGIRHGFDYDHIAAISDITSVQANRGQGMRLGLLYAVGHAGTVTLLGSAVILFQLSLPHGMDRIAERLVGATLVVLGIYVLGSLFRGDPQPRSRFQLLTGGLRWLHARIKRADHDHMPADTRKGSYSASSVLMIGVVHGLGAETPSQLMIFLLAANLGGVSKGFLGLTMFVAGLLLMNTAMTASAAGLFGATSRTPRLQYVLTAFTAIYSLAVGTFFLFGWAGPVPPLG